MTPQYSDILAFPKADLHRHIDGAVTSETMIKFADRVNLPASSAEGLKKYLSFKSEDGKSLPVNELFKRFAWAIAAMRTPEGLEEIAYDQVLDLKKENILYAELRFAPGYHSIYPASFYIPEIYEKEPQKPMSLVQTVESALKGIRKGMDEAGIVVNLGLCIPREGHIDYGLKSAYEIADLAIAFQEEGVTFIDLACDELIGPPGIYAPVFAAAANSKIKLDPHGGERGSVKLKLKNIATCIYDLYADGLGHALALYKDKNLMKAVKEMNIRIERNPWSDPVLRGREGDGTNVLLNKGVKISLCSDDPVLMQQSLTEGYAKTLLAYGWGKKEMARLVANAVNTGFYIDDNQRRKVQKLFVKNKLSRGLME